MNSIFSVRISIPALAVLLLFSSATHAQNAPGFTLNQYKAKKFRYGFSISAPGQYKMYEEENGVFVSFSNGMYTIQILEHAKPGMGYTPTKARKEAEFFQNTIVKREATPSGDYYFETKTTSEVLQYVYYFAKGPDGSYIYAKVIGRKKKVAVLKKIAYSLKNKGYRSASLSLETKNYRGLFTLQAPAKAKLVPFENEFAYGKVEYKYEINMTDAVTVSVTRHELETDTITLKQVLEDYNVYDVKAEHIMRKETGSNGELFLQLKKIDYGKDVGSVRYTRLSPGIYLRIQAQGPGPYSRELEKIARSFKIARKPGPLPMPTKWKTVFGKKKGTRLQATVPRLAVKSESSGKDSLDYTLKRNVGFLSTISIFASWKSIDEGDTFSMAWAVRQAVDDETPVVSKIKTARGFLLVVKKGRGLRAVHYIKSGAHVLYLRCTGPESSALILTKIAHSFK